MKRFHMDFVGVVDKFEIGWKEKERLVECSTSILIIGIDRTGGETTAQNGDMYQMERG